MQGVIALLLFGTLFIATTLPSSAHTTKATHTAIPAACAWITERLNDIYTPHYHDHIQFQAQYNGGRSVIEL